MSDFLEAMQTMTEEKPEIVLKPAGGERTEPQNQAVPATPPSNSQPPATPQVPAVDTNKLNAEPAKPNGEPNVAAAAPATPEVADGPFFERLSKLTGGSVKSQAEFEKLLNERKELSEKVAKGLEPKFANERAKWAHQILSNGQGDELQAAARTLRALTYNPEGKEAKDTLFEAFLMDPKNADLSIAAAQKYFDADFDRRFGDLDGDVLKERDLALATREAKEQILAIQNGFKATEEKPLQQAKEVEENVSKAVKELTGFKLSFSENAPETEILNVALDNPQELQSLQETILNPDQAYAELASRFGDEKSFDYKGFAQELYMRNNHEKFRKLAYEHGFKLGQLAKVNEARNASSPRDISQGAGAPAGGGPESLAGAWGKAMGQ